MAGSRKWRALFFSLLFINIFVITLLIILISLPATHDNIEQEGRVHEDIQFKVHTNKSDLNKLINRYLTDEGLRGPIEYHVILAEEVELYGTVPAFGRDFEMKLTFEPKALENGDLLLKQKSMSLGQLNLPVSYILSFINKQYKIPDWVSIQPNEEKIYLSLQNLKLKSNVKVKAEEFDLENDKISFILSVPN
ncbi:DUF2140 domain-containing protein [Bacillus sp. M6-12]|uniref:YpmS family protein n=1 Tax=Bacillus sp. M6-12 TaxID=2054166 RepID=UPI000C7938BE|nr:YpmS family protein [Bacillus sp. M6-12]PLS16252.1 DUF2140 domain-containing protein [Bacillus sp. M6-12]